MTLVIREHDIRPADTTLEQQRRYENDVARLLQRTDEFVATDCPACGSRDGFERFQKYTLRYQHCGSCGTLYISPRPSPPVLAEYYATSESYQYWNDVIFPASERARLESIVRPRVERLLDLMRRHRVAPGTLVEIGSGFGTFAEELASRGVFDTIQVLEPTPPLAQSCRSRGLDVTEARWEDVQLPGTANVIVAFEVIEHVFEPRRFLEFCWETLKPEGLVVLTCPNVRGFDIEILGADAPAIDAEHLNYFHPASLERLARGCRFEPLEVFTPGQLDADIVRNRILAGKARVSDPFLQRVLVDEWERLGAPFQAFLAANGLSSHMWFVGRKSESAAGRAVGELAERPSR